MRKFLDNLFTVVLAATFGFLIKFVVMAIVYDVDVYETCEHGEVVHIFEFLDKEDGGLVYLEAYILDEECEKEALTND